MAQGGRVLATRRSGMLFLAFMFTFSLVSYSPAHAQEAKLSFASGSVGATWYYAIGGFLQVIGKQLKGFQVSVAATGGSVENLRQLAKHETDFAWAQSPNMYDAWNGVGLFKGKGTRDFRMIALVYESEHTIICLDDGKIRKLADLKGKKVEMGPPGSGTAINTENIRPSACSRTSRRSTSRHRMRWTPLGMERSTPSASQRVRRPASRPWVRSGNST
jgi:TRAP transporter TAXI family solute receptor